MWGGGGGEEGEGEYHRLAVAYVRVSPRIGDQYISERSASFLAFEVRMLWKAPMDVLYRGKANQLTSFPQLCERRKFCTLSMSNMAEEVFPSNSLRYV